MQESNDGFDLESFSNRGVAVPFTTRVLLFARLRRDSDDGLEYLVPGLTGGLETCVVPHGKIGEALSLSIFDRALMEEFEVLRTVTPAGIEKSALSVGASGLGGSRRMQQARARLQLDEKRHPEIQAQLVNDLQKAAGQAMLDPKQLVDPEAATNLKPALSLGASQAHISVENLVAYSSEWTEIILPVGLPDGPKNTPYKQILQNMARFADQLMQWLVPEPVEPAEMAQRVAVAARETVQAAQLHINRIDAYSKDVESTMQEWARCSKAIRSDVETIAHIVDGWQRLIDEWDKVERLDRIDQRELVELVALYLPTLPIFKGGQKQEFWETLRANQKRWNATVGTPGLFSTDEKTREKLADFEVESE